MGSAWSEQQEEEGNNPWAEIALKSAQMNTSKIEQPIVIRATSADTFAVKLPVSISYANFSSSLEFIVLEPIVTLVIDIEGGKQGSIFTGSFERGKHALDNRRELTAAAAAANGGGDLMLRFSAPGTAELILNCDSKTFQIKTKQALVRSPDHGNKVVDLEEIFGIALQKECVICLTEPSDTLLEPCRHMCVCHACSQDLLLATATIDGGSKCPICRQGVRACFRVKKEF